MTSSFDRSWLKDLVDRSDVHVLPWPELRDIASGRGMLASMNYIIDNQGVYFVTLELSRFWTFLATFSSKHPHGVEFIAQYLPRLVQAVGDAGLPAVTVVHTGPNTKPSQNGWEYTAQPGTNIFDERLGDDDVGQLGVAWLSEGEYEVDGTAAKGSYVEFAVVDKDDVIGLFAGYGLSVARMVGLTGMSGFVAGETVTGGTSGAVATVLSVGGDYLDVQADYGAFQASEPITSTTGSATLSSTPVNAGDTIELKKYVKKKSLKGTDRKGNVDFGDSFALAKGLYLRSIVENTGAAFEFDYALILSQE